MSASDKDGPLTMTQLYLHINECRSTSPQKYFSFKDYFPMIARTHFAKGCRFLAMPVSDSTFFSLPVLPFCCYKCLLIYVATCQFVSVPICCQWLSVPVCRCLSLVSKCICCQNKCSSYISLFIFNDVYICSWSCRVYFILTQTTYQLRMERFFPNRTNRSVGWSWK